MNVVKMHKKRFLREKEIAEVKSQALNEFIQYSNNKNFCGRFKIAWNLLFKNIKITGNAKQESVKAWPKPPEGRKLREGENPKKSP